MPSASSIPALEQRARSFYQSGQLAQALRACLEILARQPQRADVSSFAGMIALRLGQHAQAAELYRTTVGLRPHYAEAHYNLGNALRQAGDLEGAAAAYGRAVALKPELGPGHHNLGYALHALGRREEAADAYRRAAALMPESAETQRSLGNVLRELGRAAESVDAYRRALALRAEWSSHRDLVMALLEHGDMRGVIAACDEWLRTSPADTQALAIKCAALNETGDREALRALLDFERFVYVTQVEAPSGYATLADFNRALAQHVLTHPTLKVPPEDDPTYHHPALSITEELLVEPKGPMAALERLIHDAIEAYRREVFAGPAHVLVEHWPRRWRLASWSAVLAGQGNLVPHVHLDGYLGGVYYVEVPEVVRARDDARHPGWFELGRPPPDLGFEAQPEVYAIQPEEGRMILFPAYFYHGTVPFESGQRRISIAFDVVPAQRAS